MQYLVDGHNLIPFIPGLHLSDMDDEDNLIHLLQIHARVSRSRIEVFFDRAAVGRAGARKMGTIMAHFLPEGYIADKAIIEKVRSLKNTASGCTVVSQDREVQSACRHLGAKIMDSREFAAQIQVSLRKDQQQRAEKGSMDAGELEEWMRLFEAGKPDKNRQD